MTLQDVAGGHIRHPDRLFIDGAWVAPASTSSFEVVDSATEEVFLRVAEAQAADLDRAIAAARTAFDEGPWPRMAHADRATYLESLGEYLAARSPDLAQLWPRQAGALHKVARFAGSSAESMFRFYADLADSYAWEEEVTPTSGGTFGLLVREPVGVVGAIIPWNAPLGLSAVKVAPALIAGCTVVLKASPEAPGEAYILAEGAEAVGLPPGVLNVVAADRAASERLVTDPRVDKISFTGSTVAGRRIASLCGDRMARVTLELGGKSAAVVLDDMDLGTAARTLARADCYLAGQVCASLTRVIVSRPRHDDLVDALAASFSALRVGDPFDERTQMGPLVSARQRDRVLDYIAQGEEQGATLATGGSTPSHLDRGYFVEPTVFGNVDNGSVIAQEEIFGPVLSVIPAEDENDAVRLANDTIYGLNASVFTNDVERAREVAGQLRSGTVGHNAKRADFGIAFGGFKQSGIGREGGVEGVLPFLEVKTVILEGVPHGYAGR